VNHSEVPDHRHHAAAAFAQSEQLPQPRKPGQCGVMVLRVSYHDEFGYCTRGRRPTQFDRTADECPYTRSQTGQLLTCPVSAQWSTQSGIGRPRSFTSACPVVASRAANVLFRRMLHSCRVDGGSSRTSVSIHGLGYLRRQGLIPDEPVLQLATFLRSHDLFLELRVRTPRTLTVNQARQGAKQGTDGRGRSRIHFRCLALTSLLRSLRPKD
jgi:hypothetical protein